MSPNPSVGGNPEATKPDLTDVPAQKIVGVGNTSGQDIDKYKRFRLTPVAGSVVEASLIDRLSSVEAPAVFG
jgi:hypothetical protein